MELRSAFNYDREKASDETGLICPEETLTQQHQREEADINTIVKRFGLTGQLPSNVRMPQYGDYTAVDDYQTALNAVMAADEVFMQMPWDIRKRFNHDPAQLLEFCADPKNLEEAKKLGLVEVKPEVLEVKKSETVPAQAPPAAAPAASQA